MQFRTTQDPQMNFICVQGHSSLYKRGNPVQFDIASLRTLWLLNFGQQLSNILVSQAQVLQVKGSLEK